MLLVASNAFAVNELIVWSVYGGGYNNWLEVKSVNNCATGAATLTTTALQDGNGKILDLSGYYLYMVATYYGATAPTDNTDLELLEHTSAGNDILYGGGTDKIDNAANNSFQPFLNGAESVMPIYGPLYQKVSNNAVNAATFTIVYKFVK